MAAMKSGFDRFVMNAETKLTEIKGIGEKTAALFHKLGIETAGDLLLYYPIDYEYYDKPTTVSEVKPGQTGVLTLTIVGKGSTVFAGGYKITTFHAADATGQIKLTYFNAPWLAKTYAPGSIHTFRGLVKQYKNGNLQLDQPKAYSPAEYEKLETTFQPKYGLTKGLQNGQVMKAVTKILKSYAFGEDYLPKEARDQMGLMEEKEATTLVHFPHSKEDMIRSRNRMVFDEFFRFLLVVKKDKATEQSIPNDRPMAVVEETKRLMEALPYNLTNGQMDAWRDIERDLSSDHIMNRLLQGDVGSGKTILAFLALLMCAGNGRQGALMAPTEVLAQQHAEGLFEMKEKYPEILQDVHPVLLTGSVKGKARTLAYKQIASGEANVIIGTHALLTESLEYKDLSLVITDEQHRFGVRQREALAGKGLNVPVLVMSATPIPRTLSIILYGDLSVSQLTELPANRLPIKNLAMDAGNRPKIMRFILDHVKAGEQAYVICPAVEESEFFENLENVKDYTEMLQKSLPSDVRVGSLNGKMKPAEKNKVMTAFANHELDILVSTTVIEVGINVPNSTVILIENAERFGLSQLHQLRGRVGRGSKQSYCIFLYSDNITDKPKRLQILEKSNDGFYIAEEDLKLRGPGDMFGTRQSGEMGFRLADIYEDADILKKASHYVEEVLSKNPDYTLPGVKSVDFRSI